MTSRMEQHHLLDFRSEFEEIIGNIHTRHQILEHKELLKLTAAEVENSREKGTTLSSILFTCKNAFPEPMRSVFVKLNNTKGIELIDRYYKPTKKRALVEPPTISDTFCEKYNEVKRKNRCLKKRIETLEKTCKEQISQIAQLNKSNEMQSNQTKSKGVIELRSPITGDVHWYKDLRSDDREKLESLFISESARARFLDRCTSKIPAVATEDAIKSIRNFLVVIESYVTLYDMWASFRRSNHQAGLNILKKYNIQED